jgi:(heptosyl)LPS beta-1,4-glucosyltransferase
VAKISVVVNSINEGHLLPRALASVVDFADEIVVIDMFSTDNTVEIAKKYHAIVYKHKFINYVEPVRNFAVSKAKGDWILIIDPDEEIGEKLARRLKKIAADPDADYYRLPRKNLVFSKWLKHSRWWPDFNIRFFKKGTVSWSEIIHGVPTTQGMGLDLPAEEDYAIIHHHYDSISEYISKMDRYTNVQSHNLFNNNIVFEWKNLIFKPSNEFLSRYFFGKGYKDGLQGLAVSALQAVSELILYLKLWELYKFSDVKVPVSEVIGAIKYSERDLFYWQADTLRKEGGSMIELVKRKFRLP